MGAQAPWLRNLCWVLRGKRVGANEGKAAGRGSVGQFAVSVFLRIIRRVILDKNSKSGQFWNNLWEKGP